MYKVWRSPIGPPRKKTPVPFGLCVCNPPISFFFFQDCYTIFFRPLLLCFSVTLFHKVLSAFSGTQLHRFVCQINQKRKIEYFCLSFVFIFFGTFLIRQLAVFQCCTVVWCRNWTDGTEGGHQFSHRRSRIRRCICYFFQCPWQILPKSKSPT